jgi:uncharacterized protein YndB with AHSA1/START domain
MKAPEPELVFERIVDAPRERVFKAWTDPVHLRRWLAPAPWTVSVVQADPRPGAASTLVMASPKGRTLMIVSVTFKDVGGRTLYSARVRHWATTETEVEVE